MLNKIKRRIIELRRKKVRKVKYSIHFDNEYIVFLFEKNKLKNNFLVISNSITNRQHKYGIIENKVNIKISELIQLADNSSNDKYNIYLQKMLYVKHFIDPLPYIQNIQNISYYDELNKLKVTTSKTKNNKLFLSIIQTDYDVSLKKIFFDKIFLNIEGKIEKYSKENIEKIYVIIQKRSKSIINKKFEAQFNETNSEIIFSVKFTPILITMMSDLNDRWDFRLNILNKEEKVIYNQLLDATEYKDFTKEEDRYLLTKKIDDKYLAAIYVTMGRNSLSIWMTDSAQYEKTYSLAVGKTIYKEVIENESISQNLCFFESFLGKNYSGSPKYIYEEMLRNSKYKDFQFVWAYNNDDKKIIPGNPIIVKRGSKEYFEYLGRAKYIINNVIFPIHKKREETVYLQTWHGTPLKKLGFDITIDGPEILGRENFYIESKMWDFLISANSYSSSIFKRAFKYEREILEYGYPANTIFYNDNMQKNIQKKVKNKISFPKDKKVILYAPTWRDNAATISWSFEYEFNFDLDELYNALSDKYVLLIKLHHLVSDTLKVDKKYSNFLINCSDYSDIQELYTITDICITDYSSVFFDFAHSKKPILFYAPDYKIYDSEIRGFYLSIEQDLPGPLLVNTEELINSINEIEYVNEVYKDKYGYFIRKFCDTGSEKNCSSKIIEKILEEGALRNG
jgi:Putative glycosyl/glycerophosphate transferases involved in teichoic acid biosynthesis TagF/TagB/EpsJ/RodC